MNAAETSASSAIADCTPLAVVSRARTTAEIETFISDVSTTSTNIAIASRIATRLSPWDSSNGAAGTATESLMSRTVAAAQSRRVIPTARSSLSAADEPERPDGAAEQPRRPVVGVGPVRDELVDETERIAQRQPVDDERDPDAERDRPATAVLDPLAHDSAHRRQRTARAVDVPDAVEPVFARHQADTSSPWDASKTPRRRRPRSARRGTGPIRSPQGG